MTRPAPAQNDLARRTTRPNVFRLPRLTRADLARGTGLSGDLTLGKPTPLEAHLLELDASFTGPGGKLFLRTSQAEHVSADFADTFGFVSRNLVYLLNPQEVIVGLRGAAQVVLEDLGSVRASPPPAEPAQGPLGCSAVQKPQPKTPRAHSALGT